jgi:hypothetical protein
LEGCELVEKFEKTFVQLAQWFLSLRKTPRDNCFPIELYFLPTMLAALLETARIEDIRSISSMRAVSRRAASMVGRK